MTDNTNRPKPNGDVDERSVPERAKPRPGEKCPADHSSIRGRRCGYCGAYFRGDDMG